MLLKQDFDNYDYLCSTYGKGLVDEELRLELESQKIGHDKFMKKVQGVSHSGSLAGTKAIILEECVGNMVKALVKFYNDADSGKAGKRHKLVSVIRELEPEMVAMVTAQTVLTNSHEFTTLNALAVQVGKAIDEEMRYARIMEAIPAVDRKGFLEELKKRNGMRYKKAFMVAKEKSLNEEGKIERWELLSRTECANVGVKLIELLCYSTGIGYLEKVHNSEGDFHYMFSLDKDLVSYIDQNNEELAQMCFYYRPMVIPPKPWNDIFDGGYYMHLKRPLKFVRTTASELKELYGDLDMPEVYNAVNTIQATAWRINKKVLDVVNEVSSWQVIPEGLNIASKEPQERPMKPEDIDTNEIAKKDWKKKTLYYFQMENTRKGKRIKVNLDLATANLYKDYGAIYFPHNLDFRGRIYPVTSFSPQGNDLCKGLLEFSEGVEIGDEGAKWLAMHGANCYGLDKAPLVDRLAWVYDNAELIQKIAEDPVGNIELWQDSDSPWCFLAFCFDWTEYLTKGTTHRSHIAVAFDGSCSGIQHFSAMLRDEIGGKAVNLTPTDSVQDIYKLVSDEVQKRVEKDAQEGTMDVIKTDKDGKEYLEKGTMSMAREWLKHGINRKVTKRSVMTLAYGSKQYGFSNQVLEDTILPALQHDMLAFSKPNQSARYMAKHIWDSVAVVVVKAVEAMDWLQEVSSLLAKDKDINGNHLPTTWVTPAGFLVRQRYMKTNPKRIKSILRGDLVIRQGEDLEVKHEGDILTLSVNIPDPSVLDSRKQRQGIAPNFVHSLDASHLMLTVNKCHSYGIDSFAMIHDSYGTHAGKAGLLFTTVREVFVQTYTDHDVLQELYEQVHQQLSQKLCEKLPVPPKKGTLDLEQVKQSLYAFA
jgi:DNA-directed RNA polymerase